MKIQYDSNAHALYIPLIDITKGQVEYTEELVRDKVNLDHDAKDAIIGIEFLGVDGIKIEAENIVPAQSKASNKRHKFLTYLGLGGCCDICGRLEDDGIHIKEVHLENEKWATIVVNYNESGKYLTDGWEPFAATTVWKSDSVGRTYQTEAAATHFLFLRRKSK